MKVFLDECVNRRIVRHIAGHDVKTARQMGWTSVKNGALLKLCEAQFDVFVTIDKHLPQQQNLASFDLAIVVLAARSNQIKDLLAHVPLLLAAIPHCEKGAATLIDGTIV
jgi:hypothetical protein